MSINIDSYTIGTIRKHPGATLDYSIDWSAWLGTDTIISSTWTVPVGITMVDDSFTTTSTTIWLSGGTNAARYTVMDTIVTTSGRIENKTFTLCVTSAGGV